MKRRKMSRKASKKLFRNAAKVAIQKQLSAKPRRGGIRM